MKIAEMISELVLRYNFYIDYYISYVESSTDMKFIEFIGAKMLGVVEALMCVGLIDDDKFQRISEAILYRNVEVLKGLKLYIKD